MRYFALYLVLCVATLLAVGCGSSDSAEEQAGVPMRPEPPASTAKAPNRAPVIDRVWLDPASPQPGEEIKARIEASDPDSDGIQFEYQWKVDGRPVNGGHAIHVDNLAKGTRIELRVVPNDGTVDGVAAMVDAVVGNQAPTLLGIVIEPLGEVTVKNDVIASPRAKDMDGDSVDFEYQWWVNDRLLNERGAVLSSDRFKRGDRIALQVIADDGSASSDPLLSKSFEVSNAAPRITSTPGSFDADGRFTYVVAAEDPDGDRRFRFNLRESPEGMEIDKFSGEVTWSPAESDAGQHSVVVEVDDRFGGVASQHFQVKVGFDADPPPAAQADR